MAALASCLLALFGSVGSARATYPGQNGLIAYTGAGAVGTSGSQVFTVLPDGSDMSQITSDEYLYSSISWSADGRRLLTTREKIHGGWQLATLGAAGGKASVVVRSNRRKRPLGPASFSPSGRRVVYTNRSWIRIASLNGQVLKRVVHAAPGGLVDAPEYSPSGKSIVFAGQPTGASRGGIWTVGRDGRHLRKLTSSAGDDFPHWSPDGRRIVFQRFPPGAETCCDQILVMRSDGSHVHQIQPTDNDAEAPVFSPNGKRIALTFVYTSGMVLGPECSDIYTLAPSGTRVQRVTSGCNPATGIGSFVAGPSWQPLRP